MFGKLSLLKKQILLYITIILISLLIFGAAISHAFETYNMNKIKNQLMDQGCKISEQYANAFFTGVVDVKQLKFEIQVLEDYMQASVFMMNSKGEISLVSSKINEKWIGQTLTNDAINGVLAGNIVTVEGKINGMFMESVLTVGYPIKVGDKVIGGIFMCSSIPDIEKSVSTVQKTVLVCLLISIIIGIILVYFSTIRISKPILEMNEAAKVIADGNFEKRINIDSEDEIGQLSMSFNNMAESLDKHEQMRRDFIANISHDLRSPLTSIQGFLNAILDGTVPEEKTNHYLNIILEETKRLNKLTNDIVLLSEAQSDKMTINKEDFDINDMIRECIEKFEPRFNEKNIDVSVVFQSEKTLVNADAEKINRVLHNLIDNALKFADTNGKIEVETTVKDKNNVYITVRDDGKVISDEEQKHIFDRFYKTDTSRGEYKAGGGLGLSIAKEFVKANGGNISVKSGPTIGTEFTFSLKLKK